MGKYGSIYEDEEDLSLGNQLHLLHRDLKRKHPILGIFERKFHRLIALAGWLLLLPFLYVIYQDYLQYVPTPEMLAYIDDTIHMSFLATLTGLFNMLFKGIPWLAIAYSACMTIYSLVVLFVDEARERQLQEKLKLKEVSLTVAMLVGLFAMGALYLGWFQKNLSERGVKTEDVIVSKVLIAGVVVVAVIICYYFFIHQLFTSDPKKGFWGPYYFILSFLRNYLAPVWWLLLLLSLGFGPISMAVLIEFLLCLYILKFIFSPKFLGALGVGLLGVLFGALGSATDEIGSGGRRRD